MRRIEVDTSDPYRAILTDVLPYETPFFFSNEGFHENINALDELPEALRVTLIPRDIRESGLHNFKGKTIPYKYTIKKSVSGTRKLALMHPRAQIHLARLYDLYSEVIIALCLRSKFSLRRPVSITEEFIKELDVDDAEVGSSFFEYADHLLLSEFFNSHTFQNLEKKYSYLLSFDVAKCFDSIYTHSIGWAVRQKAFTKVNTSNCYFENIFDKILQFANWNETAGILIGPEASRIFAEIILQHIDLSAETELSKRGYRNGVDYSVKRYVDDYHVFTHREDTAIEIQKVFERELSEFRLSLNESKNSICSIPFMTSISCAKIDVSQRLNEFFSDTILAPIEASKEGIDLPPAWFAKAKRSGIRQIHRIKAATVDRDVEFSAVSGLALSVLESNISRIHEVHSRQPLKSKYVVRMLLETLDVVFYVLSMDLRPGSSYKACRIMLSTMKVCELCTTEVRLTVLRKCFEEVNKIVERQIRASSIEFLEVLNLLSTIRTFGDEFTISSSKVMQLVEICIQNRSQRHGHTDYFFYTSLLFYIGDLNIYDEERQKLIDSIREIFQNSSNHDDRTDLTCLLFDLVSCPFLGDDDKRFLLRNFRTKQGNLNSTEVHNALEFISSRIWFSNWQARDDVEVMLVKKKFRRHYS